MEKLTGSLCFLRFICLYLPFHLRKRVLILFGFRSIFISLPLSTVCEEREFTFLTVRLMLDVLSKYSYSLYIGTLQVRHWSVTYYRWQFPIWRERFKDPLTKFAKYIRISGKISIVERISNLFASYETSQWVQSRLVKILYLYDWICLLESGLFDLLFVSTAEIALPQIKFRAAKARITICKLFVVHVPARMCCTRIVLSLLLFQLPSCF